MDPVSYSEQTFEQVNNKQEIWTAYWYKLVE